MGQPAARWNVGKGPAFQSESGGRRPSSVSVSRKNRAATIIVSILAPVLAVSFGLWWVIFPVSVIRFYTWFHGGKVKMPKPSGVRIAGAVWLLILTLVVVFGGKKGPV